MIQKMMAPGKGFGGVAAYAMRQDKNHEIVAGNVLGDDAKQIARELAACKDLNQRVEKPVMHASISLPDGKELTAAEWQPIAEEYVRRMGYERAPWVAIRHRDTEHDHIHIIASRIDRDGRKVRDTQEKRRGNAIVSEIARAHGLETERKPEREKDAGRRAAPTREEIGQAKRTGRPPARYRIRYEIEHAREGAPDLEELRRRLAARGVTMHLHTQESGRIYGVSYEVDGVRMAGGKVGKSYTLGGLQKSGISRGREIADAALQVTKARYVEQRDAAHEARQAMRQAAKLDRELGGALSAAMDGRKRRPSEKQLAAHLARTVEPEQLARVASGLLSTAAAQATPQELRPLLGLAQEGARAGAQLGHQAAQLAQASAQVIAGNVAELGRTVASAGVKIGQRALAAAVPEISKPLGAVLSPVSAIVAEAVQSLDISR